MDNYLDKYITPQLTITATEDIARRYPNITDTAVINKLITVRSYLLICLSNQASNDDLFTAKHKLYSKELADIVKTAKTNKAKANNTPLFSIPIVRG